MRGNGNPARRVARAGLTAVLAFPLVALHPLRMPAVPDVDLALVLAVDVSASMDADEQGLQRQGYARALSAPEVEHAIASGAYGRIAITYLEWGGDDRVIVPWTIVSTSAEAASFAKRILASPRAGTGLTSISTGLLFAEAQYQTSGVNPLRKVIDVSGDRPNNSGPPVDATRDAVVRKGITINGLAITVKGGEGFGWFPGRPPDILASYYRDCVIGGPGAFLVTVDNPAQFEKAIRRKLVLEISGLPPRVIRTVETLDRALIDCRIGEKNRHPADPGHPLPLR